MTLNYCLLLSLAFLLSTVASAWADVIYLDKSASGSNNGESWANAYTTLDDAVRESGNDDEIWVAQGIYTTSGTAYNKLWIYGGFDGDETVRSHRDMDPVTNGTVLTGRINMYNKADVRIYGLTFTDPPSIGASIYLDNNPVNNGSSPMPTSVEIYNCRFVESFGILGVNSGSQDEISLIIKDCSFENCRSTAIEMHGAVAEITDCVFVGNTGGEDGGGAIFMTDVVDAFSAAVVTGCSFESNAAQVGDPSHGGAILVEGSDLTIDKCSFQGNSAGFGGGIYISDTTEHETVFLLTDSSFIGNEAETAGGAIAGGSLGALTFPNCIFNGNSAVFGGGLYFTNTKLTLDDCSFSSNESTHGGGGAVFVQNNNDERDLTVIDCRFKFNSTMGEGGAIYHDGFSGEEVTCTDCEFVYNDGSSGGAIWSNGVELAVTRCDFTANDATGFAGGAIFYVSDVPAIDIVLDDCSFAMNSSGIEGGAIHSSSNNLIAKRCDFNSNTTGARGGAVFVDGGAEIANSAFRKNSAKRGGALVGKTGTTNEVSVRGCSFGYNSATDSGGAIADAVGISSSVTSTYIISNSVLFDNSSGSADSQTESTDIDPGSEATFNNCLVQHFTAAELNASGTGGGGNLNSVGNPAGFRGEGDLHLSPGSLAIDAGDNFFAPESEDLDGQPRIQNGTVNIGAYESQPERFFVKPGGSGSETGASWADAATLREALSAAVAGRGDEIWVQGGIYNPGLAAIRDMSFELKDGVAVYGGFGGFESELFQRSGGAEESVLSGDINSDGDPSNDTYQIVTAIGVGSGTVLDGFTIIGGHAGLSGGGGLLMEDSDVVVRGCKFIGNTAGFQGAAVLVEGGDPSFINCEFRDNRCETANLSFTSHGGAAYFKETTVDLVNCAFTGNFTKDLGGAVFAKDSNVGMTNCSFGWNTAGDTGGAVFYENSSGAIQNTIIWCNSATSSATAESMGFDGADLPSFESCLIEHFPAIFIDGTGGGNNFEGADAANNPLFVGSSDLSLRLGSPAIDVGDNALNSYSKDLDGVSRIQNGTINLGAYESQSGLYFVDASATGTDNGSSWANAFVQLPSAIAVASRGDEIWVARGVYRPTGSGNRSVSFELKDGVAIRGHFAGDEASLDERDLSLPLNGTVLSGDIGGAGNLADNSFHVVRADGVGDGAILDGVAIRYGRATGSTAPDDAGGGLLCENGASPMILRCQFLNNQALDGGAFHAVGGSAPLLSDCLFVGNSANGNGGAIHNKGSDPVVVNGTFSGNHAGGIAGAIYNQNANPRIVNTIAWGNTADGGNDTFHNTPASTPEVNFSLFEGWLLGAFGSGNLLGNTINISPDFVRLPSSGDGSWATLGDNDLGDLHLEMTSPVSDAGDNDATKQAIDLDGGVRVVGSGIDLGAYEGGSGGSTFAGLYPALDPNADDDGNGRSNFLDYALGENPLQATLMGGSPVLSESAIIFTHRTGALDAVPVYEITTDLQSWRPMVDPFDYSVVGELVTTQRTVVTLRITPDERVFYRVQFGR